MSIIRDIINNFKEDKYLKYRYLNKTICIVSGNVSIDYHIHKVSNGYLYTYHGNKEIKFKPY